MSQYSDEELENIRLDILTTPKSEYPKIIDHKGYYAPMGHYLGDQVLIEHVLIDWGNGRQEWHMVANMKGHLPRCWRYKQYGPDFPVLMLDSCLCHAGGETIRKKSRGRWSKD